jgi:hypothetical protein
MCLGDKEAHDGWIDAGMLWITGLVAEHKAGFAERQLVGNEETLSLRITGRDINFSTSDQNAHECA